MEYNPITLREWLDALRSGKYPQGKDCLKDSQGLYCCLGVGAELSGQETTEGLKSLSYPRLPFLSDLPEEMKNSANNVSLDGSRVSALNDRGVSFSEIADLVEKRARELGWDG